jgi:hypothetical protein
MRGCFFFSNRIRVFVVMMRVVVTIVVITFILLHIKSIKNMIIIYISINIIGGSRHPEMMMAAAASLLHVLPLSATHRRDRCW